MVGEVVDEEKKARKFEWQDATDACMVFVIEFDAKQVLEKILVWARIKRWAETVRRDNCHASKHGFVRVTTMEEIFE